MIVCTLWAGTMNAHSGGDGAAKPHDFDNVPLISLGAGEAWS